MSIPLPLLTPAIIQAQANETSYSRGQRYWRSGAVVFLTQRQQTLQAEVEGNAALPYRVTIDFDGGGVTNADCTCPYCFEGWCKHIVAVLLVCVQQPEKIEQRPALAQLLDRLTLVQAQGLVQSLVAANPELINAIDLYVSQLALSKAASEVASSAASISPKRQTSVDPAPFKRQAREVLRNAVRGWEYGQDDDEIAADMGEVITMAMAFVEQGDAANGLVALEAITAGCADNWDEIDHYCGLTPLDVDLDFDEVWAEALLSATYAEDLSEEEIGGWQEKLEIWQDQLGSFAMALEALRQGWDYPPLVRVLQGEVDQSAWGGEAPDWGQSLSKIRLSILARQQRYEEYLHLAQAEQLSQQYMTMLGQLGRVDQAMAVAQTQMTTLAEAKALAETLRSQNQLPQALEIALQGLRLGPHNPYIVFDFAIWTSDLAEGVGDTNAAVEAREIAFAHRPSFKEYQKLKALAGASWPRHQSMLLQQLRDTEAWGIEQAQVSVFLHEGLLEDAITAVSNSRHCRESVVWQVMDAVMDSHSQWVIDQARPPAEKIIDEGRAKDYDVAVNWLKRVKGAYQALGQESTWSHYHQKLATTHGRKRKLMGLMQQNL
jgi:uncharacterized Zn finger protein